MRAAPRLDVTAHALMIDGVPCRLNVSDLSAQLGTPRLTCLEAAVPWPYRATWDDAGVAALGESAEKIAVLQILLAQDSAMLPRQDLPRHTAAGLTLAGASPLDAFEAFGEDPAQPTVLQVRVGDFRCELDLRHAAYVATNHPPVRERTLLAERLRAQHDPVSVVSVVHAPSRPSTGRWDHGTSPHPALGLQDRGLALAVLQHLMYDTAMLEPLFDVEDFAADQGEAAFDPFSAPGPVPAVLDWFEHLPVPREVLAGLHTLRLRSDAEIYRQVFPLWDGEDGAFDVLEVSPQDLARLPGLRVVEDDDGQLTWAARVALEAAGIQVR